MMASTEVGKFRSLKSFLNFGVRACVYFLHTASNSSLALVMWYVSRHEQIKSSIKVFSKYPPY